MIHYSAPFSNGNYRESEIINSVQVLVASEVESLKTNMTAFHSSDICNNNNFLQSSGLELDDFLESALIHTVEVANEELFDFSDSICAVCETGGDLICCDGRCLRAFHLSCIGLQEEDVPDDVPFNCSDCLNFVQRCFLCKQFAFEENMVKCSSKMCGKYYHSQCTGGYESENADPRTFICKLHSCDICNEEMHNSSLSKLKQPWRCFRCPKAYDAKHRPKDVHILMEGIFLCIRHIQEEEEMPELPVELQLAIAEKHLKNRDFNSLLSQSPALSDSIETQNNEDRSKLKCTTTGTNNFSSNSSNSSTSNPTLSNSNGKINYEVELILEKQRQQALHEGIKELLDHSATPQNILIPKKRKAVEVVVTSSPSTTATSRERNNNNNTSHDVKILSDVNEEELNEHDIKSLGKKADDTSTTSSLKNHLSKNKLKNNKNLKSEAIDINNKSEISRPHIHMESNDNNRSRSQQEKIPYDDDFRYHSSKKKNDSIEDYSSRSRSSIDNSSSSSRNNSWTEKKRRYESSDSKDDNDGDNGDNGGDYYRYHCHRNTTTTSSSKEYNDDMGPRQQQQESNRNRKERSSSSRSTTTPFHRIHHQYNEELENDYHDDNDDDNEDDDEKGHSYRSQRGFHNMKEHEMAMDNVPTAAIVLQNHKKKGCRRIHTAPYKTTQQLLTQPTNIVSTINRSYSDNTYNGNDQLRNTYAFNATSSSSSGVSSSFSGAPNYRNNSTGMSRTARLLSGNFMNATFANNQRTSRQPVVASKNSFVGALIRNVDDTNANSYHDTKEKLPTIYSTRSGTSSNGGMDTPNYWQEKRNRLAARSSRDDQQDVRFNSNINTPLDSSTSSSNYTRKYDAAYDYSSNGTATSSSRARFITTEANGRRGATNNTFIAQPSLAPGENSGYYSNHNSHQQLDRFTNGEYVSTSEHRSANIDESGLVTDLYYPTTSRAANGTEASISSRYAGNHSVDIVRGSSMYFKHNNYYSDENSKKLLSLDAYPPAERPTKYLQNSVIVAPKNFDCSTSNVYHRHLTSESDYFHTYNSSIEHVITNSIGYREIGGHHHTSNFVEPATTYLTAALAGGSQTIRTSILDDAKVFGGHQNNYKQSPHVVRGSASNIRIANKDKGGNTLSGITASATTSSAPIVDINDLFTQLQSCGLLPS